MPRFSLGRRCRGRVTNGGGWRRRHGHGHGHGHGGGHGHGHRGGGFGRHGRHIGLSSWFGGGCAIGRPNYYTYGHVDPTSDDDDDDDVGGVIVPSPDHQRPKPDPKDKGVLEVESVDFKVAENVSRHHTDEYDITEGRQAQLVVRRGQPFTMDITFSRPYDAKKDDLRLCFEIGPRPLVSKGTQAEFILSDKDEKGQWGAKVSAKSRDGKTLTITVFTPPTLPVGKWRFRVNVVKRSDTQTSVFSYKHENPIYVLFNPWCKEDTVYMEHADDQQAYVLKEDGKIYSGNTKKIAPKPWVFGQFSGNVLDCCMYLLKLSEMDFSARGDPVRVVRKLTAMVNSSDDDGVLTGNWSGDYSGGKSPLSWTGSAPILEQYWRTKSPVEYGQCWVFSGVLTTVCRALGLPARSVTNFASAHDSDTSITIDMHYNHDGSPLEDMDQDSVWNFHVWNEVWMARPDLPAGYGGWQACDATPQETSDGVYCCGPCPLRAIKEGEVSMNYDGTFIFAEVNADRIYWVREADGSWVNTYTEKKSIGKFISTLAKNPTANNHREDVTNLYKYPEDSAEERVAVRKANLVGSNRKDAYQAGPNDVKFEMKHDPENSFVGEDFSFQLHCKNNSKENRTVEGRCSVNTMYYTGVVADLVAEQAVNVQLKPGESKAVVIKVAADDYHPMLKDCCMLSLSAMARVFETRQIFTKKDDTRLIKPGLNIKAPSTAQKNKEFEVEVSFSNPLHKTLTDCYLELEGPGLGSPKRYPQGDVSAKGTFLTKIKLKPLKKGQKDIVAIFSARELEDINGSHEITVPE